MRHGGFELDLEETFDGGALDPGRWIDHSMPQWGGWEATRERYELGDGLHLLIEEDQPPWCPALDGDLQVSSLQTALVAGPVGGTVGWQPFDPPARVVDGPHHVRLSTLPRAGSRSGRRPATTLG